MWDKNWASEADSNKDGEHTSFGAGFSRNEEAGVGRGGCGGRRTGGRGKQGIDTAGAVPVQKRTFDIDHHQLPSPISVSTGDTI